MNGFTIEYRPALTYCALPLTCEPSTLAREIPVAYRSLDLQLAECGIENRGMALVRYRKAVRRGPIEVEVGWLFSEPADVPPPHVSGGLPAGEYVVTIVDGPYANLAAVGRDAGRRGPEGSVEVCQLLRSR